MPIGTDPDDARRDSLRCADRRSGKRSPEYHACRRDLGRERVDRRGPEVPGAHAANDTPTAHSCSEREGQRRRDTNPARDVEVVDRSRCQQDSYGETHRLLPVVGTVADRDEGRCHPDATPDRPQQAARAATETSGQSRSQDPAARRARAEERQRARRWRRPPRSACARECLPSGLLPNRRRRAPPRRVLRSVRRSRSRECLGEQRPSRMPRPRAQRLRTWTAIRRHSRERVTRS